MKKIILLLIPLVALVKIAYSNERIFSKFHQSTYKLKDLRLELFSYDKDYIRFFQIKAFKFNRTTTAHNLTLNIKVNAGNKTEVVVQAYKFLSNEYRHFPVRFQVNIQKGFEANVIGLRALTKCGNITSLKFYKDITYHACNFVLDETQFPPLIPNGKYKTELTVLFVNKAVAVLNLYGEVCTPVPYPKN